jgi:hypothetical protein
LFGGTFTACRKIGKDACLELVAIKKDADGSIYPFVIEVLNIPPDVDISLTSSSTCDNSDLSSNDIGGPILPSYSSYCWRATKYTFQIKKISASSMELTEL